MASQYQQTLQSLQSILQSLERDNVSIDDLESRLTQGFELLALLRDKLTATEVKIEEIINTRLGESIEISTTNKDVDL